jgi:7-carboxy-7-deazaguanine synthase
LQLEQTVHAFIPFEVTANRLYLKALFFGIGLSVITRMSIAFDRGFSFAVMALVINEIFHSIQGESSWAGLPFVFIRLTGCNLRCRYCDSVYAYDEGTSWETAAILEYIKGFGCPRVTLTGGEPLIQENTPDLVEQLIAAGYTVTMETNGSRDITRVDRRCIKIMDLKGPSSGMQHHNRMENVRSLGPEDQVKIVIADRDDFDFALTAAHETGKCLPAGHLLFSPAYGILSAEQLAQWMLEARVDARLQIQLHRYIWPAAERGV